MVKRKYKYKLAFEHDGEVEIAKAVLHVAAENIWMSG